MSVGLMHTLDTIESYVNQRSEVQRAPLPDGSHKLLSVRPKGPSYFVLHEKPAGGEASVIYETPFQDVAASVFDAFDGTVPAWARAYHPRGGLPVEKEDATMPVYAVGGTVEDCVRGFFSRTGDELRPGSLETGEGGEDLGPDAQFQWEARFTSLRSGTGFKAAGAIVPGGYVMTWWK